MYILLSNFDQIVLYRVWSTKLSQKLIDLSLLLTSGGTQFDSREPSKASLEYYYLLSI